MCILLVVLLLLLWLLPSFLFCRSVRARIPGSWDLTESIEMFPDALWFETSDRLSQHVFFSPAPRGFFILFKKHASMASGLQIGSLCLHSPWLTALYNDECDFCRVRVRVSFW